MTAARYGLGVAGLAILVGGFALLGRGLARKLLPRWQGAEAVLAAAFLGVACLLGALEALGALRLFRAPAMVLAGGAAAVLARARLPSASPVSGAAPSRRRAGAYVALIACAVVGAEWLTPTLDSLSHGIRTLDTLWYHLPWSASYAQTGQVTSLRFTDVEYLTAFYPASSELLHGAGIALLGRDTLSPLLNLGWLALALLAAWCVGSVRGRGPAAVLAAACVLATPMMLLSQAGSAANDLLGIFFLLCAVAFGLSAEQDGSARGLAALAAGLAIATKLSLLAPALLVAAAALPRPLRWRGAGRWLGALVLGGAFWYVRNLLAVGNPLPWLSLPGLAVPAAPLQAHTGYSVFHYLGSSRFLAHFLVPGLHAGLGWAWPAWLALAVLAPAAAVLAGRGPSRRLGVVALGSLLAYALTPESAAGPAGHPAGFALNLRYASPALVLALLALIMLPLARVPRAGRWLAGAAALLLLFTLARASLWPSRHLAGALLLAGGAAAGAAIALGAGRRHRRPAAALALLLLVPAGYAVQRSYLNGRYRTALRVSQMSVVWSAFRRVHHARVGLSGTYGAFFAYPLFGLDDSDRVSYLARHGPHGSFTPITSCREWRRAVNAGRFSYLVSTPARDPWRPHRLTPSPEAGWTLGDPHARVILVHRAAGAAIYVFRLTGPLAPGSCG